MQIYKSGPDLGEMTDKFRQIPFLKAFGDRYLQEILNASRMIIYEPDDLIIPEGAFGDRLYVLISGRVRVVKQKNPVASLDQVGDLFGELAALGDETRTASVFATTTTWCLEFNSGLLKKLPATDRDACYALLYRHIAEVVAGRLKKTTDELVLAARELEVTRRKLAELRRNSGRESWDDELDLAINQLRRTKEKLALLGRTPAEAPTQPDTPPESP
ncbi:MAG: cyclic nucleotide-binding domain-containing protein [Candidatus Competibacter sp.]|nr:cyclic nucleotide-binding domain-containing protein [Candidatus Competibacter sp.]MDG4607431.1 cyclic nucleotide-binding domain-containing protein [Candidatus Contendobacter sp.]HRD50471.1 cyclic nucleotide-binding domain-containing protein [Candidatus Contendobacter sp.]